MKTCLIVGSSASAEAERLAALELFEPDEIIAINEAGIYHIGPFQHWATVHTEKVKGWKAQREQEDLSSDKTFWTYNTRDIPAGLEFERIPDWNGSSGLLAVEVAMILGCDKIVLAGVPLDEAAGHSDGRTRWLYAEQYQKAWLARDDQLQGIVKSMSGWTAERYGRPTKKWLSAKVKAVVADSEPEPDVDEQEADDGQSV